MFVLRITGDLGFEFWKDIPGFNGEYQASTYGRIRKGETVLKGTIYKGYIRYFIRYDSPKRYSGHRLVANTFIPNFENKPCIDHIDTNRQNNNVSNLRWVTEKENHNNPLSIINHSKASKKHIGIMPCKRIAQLSIDGELIREWRSAEDASKNLGILRCDISAVCNNLKYHKTAGGFKWKFIE